jgi:DNA-binding protein H-NS
LFKGVIVVLDEDLKHQSPSIVAETSNDFGSMSVAELWKLHENVGAILVEKISAELSYLKTRLASLKPAEQHENLTIIKRRTYPRIRPKYRNPEKPSETWAGRGRQPAWVKLLLSLGMRLEDLTIR